MSSYHIDVRTNKNLGSESFVHSLLTAWCNHSNVRLRPEYFALGEPIRRSFAEEGVQAAVHLWMSNGMPVMLKRRKQPKFEVSIDWRREKGLDTRMFPWSCTVWINTSAGDESALEVLRFLIRFFEPAFGHISTQEDIDNKHWITYEDALGQAEEYVGLDVGDSLPGVYWATYFGHWAAEKIGRERFANLKAQKIEPLSDGYLILAYKSCKEAGSSTAREAENRIIEHLGKRHFFDKAEVDIEALRTDPETARMLEKEIEVVKRNKKTPQDRR